MPTQGRSIFLMLIIIAKAQTLDFMECDRCVLLFQGISSRASVESNLGILHGELNHTLLRKLRSVVPVQCFCQNRNWVGTKGPVTNGSRCFGMRLSMV